MNNKEFGKQLEIRTKNFAISIIKSSIYLSNTQEVKVIKNQITKSGTSIGANYREANRSRSKADFKNKIKISESEASETVYWLEIIEELNWIKEDDIGSIPNGYRFFTGNFCKYLQSIMVQKQVSRKPIRFEYIINEAKEILAIFTSISKNLKA